MLTTHQFTAMLRELLADAILKGGRNPADAEKPFDAAERMMQEDSRVAHLLNSLPTGGI